MGFEIIIANRNIIELEFISFGCFIFLLRVRNPFHIKLYFHDPAMRGETANERFPRYHFILQTHSKTNNESKKPVNLAPQIIHLPCKITMSYRHGGRQCRLL